MASRSRRNIKIAVRVRQFNKQETNERRIVEASGNLLKVRGKEDDVKEFSFDRVFWSHDGYIKEADGYFRKSSEDSKYADQRFIFADLGEELLENAWNGYNCSIFAYGQTGSGKSYTMMGEHPNKGLVPLFCERLFDKIEEEDSDVEYQVSFSMLEIYNEEVRDLLGIGEAKSNILRLKTRISDVKTFYAYGLKEVPVNTAGDVKKLIDIGNQKKSKAATKMNEHSSRSHTIAAVKLTQIFPDKKSTKESEIKLVDLAGSENAKLSDTSGKRLAEGKKINQSLLALGMVIETLCKGRQELKAAVTHINSSVLTKLMTNSLGGNCKTIMIATISPGEKTSAFTLSTLRYASKAGNIQNDAKVNEGDIIKQRQAIIDTKEAELRRIEKQKMTAAVQQEIQKLQKEIEDLKSKKVIDEQFWKEELKRAKRDMEETYDATIQKLDCPHLVNISEDPQLSHRICHPIPEGATRMIGSSRNKENVDIVLYGPSIAYNHATLRNVNGSTKLTVLDGVVKIGGGHVDKNETIEIHHLQPILFGENYTSGLYVFVGGDHEERNKQTYPLFEDCVSEISRGDQNDKTADKYLKAQVTVLRGYCTETTEIATSQRQDIHFEPRILPSICIGINTNRYLTIIKAVCDERVYYIEEDDFLDIHERTRELNDLLPPDTDTNEYSSLQNTEDLIFPVSKATRFGIAIVEKWSNQTKVSQLRVAIHDFDTNHIGYLTVERRACDKKGKATAAISPPKVSKAFFFQLSVQKAEIESPKMAVTWCEYIFPATEKRYQTNEVPGQNPEYNFHAVIGMEEATPLFVQTVKEEAFLIQLWGRYEEASDSIDDLSGKTENINKILREENDRLRTENESLRQQLNQYERTTTQ